MFAPRVPPISRAWLVMGALVVAFSLGLTLVGLPSPVLFGSPPWR